MVRTGTAPRTITLPEVIVAVTILGVALTLWLTVPRSGLESVQNQQAQAAIHAATDANIAHRTANGSFTMSPSALRAIDGQQQYLPQIAEPTGPGQVSVGVDDGVLTVTARAETGVCWFSRVTPSGHTQYGAYTTARPCSASQAAQAVQAGTVALAGTWTSVPAA